MLLPPHHLRAEVFLSILSGAHDRTSYEDIETREKAQGFVIDGQGSPRPNNLTAIPTLLLSPLEVTRSKHERSSHTPEKAGRESRKARSKLASKKFGANDTETRNRLIASKKIVGCFSNSTA